MTVSLVWCCKFANIKNRSMQHRNRQPAIRVSPNIEEDSPPSYNVLVLPLSNPANTQEEPPPYMDPESALQSS